MIGKYYALIPARSGSKGIPWKNIRILGDKPLICHTISAAIKSHMFVTVDVSTDDPRIADISKNCGANIPFMRPDELSTDSVPLADVVYHYKEYLEKTYDIGANDAIVLLQATSPLRDANDIINAIAHFERENSNSLMSVIDFRHLLWIQKGNGMELVQRARVNRQELEQVYLENGAIFISKINGIEKDNFLQKPISFFPIDKTHAIDIDTFDDLKVIDNIMSMRKIVLTVKAGGGTGLGHFYRTLELSKLLKHHDLTVIGVNIPESTKELFNRYLCRYIFVDESELIDGINKIKPNLVINDILDTSREYMIALNKLGVKTLNLEDLGPGSKLSDYTVNALYHDFSFMENHVGGGKYAILHHQFQNIGQKLIVEHAKNILITFGGTDPMDYTQRVSKVLVSKFADMDFRIIVGVGNFSFRDDPYTKELERMSNVSILYDVSNMADHIQWADLMISSAGRTVFEAAACHTPLMVFCQNSREERHRHASFENGIINFGIVENDNFDELIEIIRVLRTSHRKRMEMSQRIGNIVDGLGAARIMQLINELIY